MRRALACLLVSLAGAAAAFAAFAPGGTAYTKRVETDLLSDSKASAPVCAQLGYARKVKIDQVRGLWLHVKDSSGAGWVFSGNVSEDKISDSKGMDGVPMAASQTSASSAARPLAPAAEEYGDRKGLGEAKDDVIWLEGKADGVKSEDVTGFLKANKKGEFQ